MDMLYGSILMIVMCSVMGLGCLGGCSIAFDYGLTDLFARRMAKKQGMDFSFITANHLGLLEMIGSVIGLALGAFMLSSAGIALANPVFDADMSFRIASYLSLFVSLPILAYLSIASYRGAKLVILKSKMEQPSSIRRTRQSDMADWPLYCD